MGTERANYVARILGTAAPFTAEQREVVMAAFAGFHPAGGGAS